MHDTDRQSEPIDLPPLDTEQTEALELLREEIATMAEASHRATGGASYEAYARVFTDVCASWLEDCEPPLRGHAIRIAKEHGYDAELVGSEAGFGPGLCPITGNEEAGCPCGYHP